MLKQPSRKKAVMTQALGGYLNTTISIVQGLLLLPIYFKFVSIATYGYWVTIGSIIALLSIVNFGVGNLSIQRISTAYAKKDFQKVGDYFINSLYLFTIISIVFIFLGVLLYVFFDEKELLLINERNNLVLAYFIALNTMVLTFFNNALKGFSNSLLKPLFGVYSTVISRIVGIALLLIMLYSDYGLLSIPLSLLLTEILVFISNSIYVRKQYVLLKIKSKFNKKIMLDYLNMSPHLFGLIFGNMLLNKSHSILITALLSAEITTLYTITRKVIDIILQAVNIVNSSLIAPFSHLVGEGDEKKIRYIVLKIIGLSFFVSVIMYGIYMIINHTFISLWLDNEKVLNQNIILFIGLGALAHSMTRIFRSILFGFDKFKFTSFMVVIEGISFVLLSIVLIKLFHIIGIAISLFVVSGFISIILLYRIFKEIKIQIRIRDMLKLLLFFTLLILFIVNSANFFDNENSWFILFIKLFLSIVVLISLEYLVYSKYLKGLYFNGRK